MYFQFKCSINSFLYYCYTTAQLFTNCKCKQCPYKVHLNKVIFKNILQYDGVINTFLHAYFFIE